MYICIYVYMYVCIYVYMYIYISKNKIYKKFPVDIFFVFQFSFVCIYMNFNINNNLNIKTYLGILNIFRTIGNIWK